MKCNNKSILEGSDQGEKFVRGLLSQENDKIKGDNYENIKSIM